MLSKHDQKWLKANKRYDIGAPMTMTYDHRDQEAVEILNQDPPRFALVDELKEAGITFP